MKSITFLDVRPLEVFKKTIEDIREDVRIAQEYAASAEKKSADLQKAFESILNEKEEKA